METNLNLRVFRRTDQNIIILWNTDGISEEQKNNVKIILLEKEKEDDTGNLVNKEIKEIKFELSDDSKEFKTKKGVAIAVINHEENQISKDESILIKLVLGVKDKIEQFLRISPYGVLPNFERDNKKQHVQLMGYVKSKKRWAKVPLIKTEEGLYALPVKIVK